jgi:hypothetical protein
MTTTTLTRQHDRVVKATPQSINEKIEAKIWENVADYADKSPAEISKRIEELDKEWDIERYLEVNMSTIALSGFAASVITKNNYWLILPAVVLGFFFQHAVQGWCPPLPILRKLHIRTRKEIEREKYALKFIRGDFKYLNAVSQNEIHALRQAVSKV